MESYAQSILTNTTQYPDPTDDIERFSGQHSWYKHLGPFVKAYPLLAIGEEPTYSFDEDYTDPNQTNLHWRIILEYNLNHYQLELTQPGEVILIPVPVKEYMKQFPIYLSSRLTPVQDATSDFQKEICKRMCKEFWNGLQKYKN